MEEGGENVQDSCYGAASIAGAVIGTFLTTILLIAVAALVYRQWRRNKGKHLVLVTNPEIVEDAYAFDNPCFKDATPAVTRNHENRPLSTASLVDETPTKDSARWSSPWSSLGLPSVNKNDKRRTLDDSCLGPKSTWVNVVSLRSRDFTGLGFNVCGNMREGIFVKDLLHRGPASESGRIHPGDRIASVKISFRSMVYEDALTILSYASPYDVELEVESGGSVAGSRPTTLLKKTVGPSPSRICHPLYRSQSIPELSQSHKTSAKRLFIADPNESIGSNYSTMNSTMKSSKSTPGSQTLERRHEEAKNLNENRHKFGMKFLRALDDTVHRIENQNEHNTNLERRNSKKLDAIVDAKRDAKSNNESVTVVDGCDNRQIVSERYRERERQPDAKFFNNVALTKNDDEPGKSIANAVDSTERNNADGVRPETVEAINIPSEVPAEVHNAAMAARRNRRSSTELLNSPKPSFNDSSDNSDAKSPQKNKRKAPAPPKVTQVEPDFERSVKREMLLAVKQERENPDDSIESIADYAESLNDYVGKVREITMEDDAAVRRQRLETNSLKRRNSESDSDTDSEIHNSFTTIELKPADITIHHTPVPRADGEPEDEEDDDDSYRKAASLGDLSKYENKSLATLERAQSLDMADAGSKKRKIVASPPEDINESTEDVKKLDHMDSFDRRKLKKSDEWGTLEDAIWNKTEIEQTDNNSRTRKRSNGTLERSKSSVEIKLKEAGRSGKQTEDGRLVPVEMPEETSIELYNLPLSKRLTTEFIDSERTFNPDRDNSLARIVNNGTIVKSPSPEEMELDFRQARPISDDGDDIEDKIEISRSVESSTSPTKDEFAMALRYFDNATKSSDKNKSYLINRDAGSNQNVANGASPPPSYQTSEEFSYAGRNEAHEEPMKKITVVTGCPGCEKKFGNHDHRNCNRTTEKNRTNYRDSGDWLPQEVSKLEESPTEEKSGLSAFEIGLTKFEKAAELRARAGSPMESKIERQLLMERGIDMDVELEEEEEDGYDFGSRVRVGSKNASSPTIDRHNVSNVSVSSGENSEDSGLVGESGDYGRQDSETSRPPLPETPMPRSGSPQKLTYITEIKVSTSRENLRETPDEKIVNSSKKELQKFVKNDSPITSNGKSNSGKKPPVPPRRNDASKLATKETEPIDKQVVYVSEYKSVGAKDRIENSDKVSGTPVDKQNKKLEQWIYLGDNTEQNPWGNGSSQSQPVTNIVVSTGDDKKKSSSVN